jgi:hypothetical protein
MKVLYFKLLKNQQRTVILATLLYQTLLGKARETKHAHQCGQEVTYQCLPNYPHFSLHSNLTHRLHQAASEASSTT